MLRARLHPTSSLAPSWAARAAVIRAVDVAAPTAPAGRTRAVRGATPKATTTPTRAALRAAAMQAALRAEHWFAARGLGWNDGVRPATIVIRNHDLLRAGTSSNPSWLFDGTRTISLEPFRGTSDALRPDIVAHEYAHGVIERFITDRTPEANALNEALADVFAVAIDDRDNDVDGRSLSSGEGIWRIDQIPAGGFGSTDNGGEHAMMGIITHPAAVLAEQCGRQTMAAIYLRAMTKHLLPGAQSFAGFALATLQATIELYGAGSREYAALWTGWNQVGLTRDVIAARLAAAASAGATSPGT